MAGAPTVQSVEQIIADLNPAYAGSESVIAQRRAALPGQFDAQRAGLEAAKVQGFNQINNQATGRGMSFSGIPLDEQANYLSTKYLPGMQQLTFQQNEANLALDDALAKINQERRLKAMDIRQNQQSALERYLAEERERAWQQQKFAAEQAMERAKMAQQAAASRASSAASAQPSWQDALRRTYAAQSLLPGQKQFALERAMSGVLESYGDLNPQEVYNYGYSWRKKSYGF